ncbi:MAG: hypothetical protein HOV94_10900 [Saccharothrix sp.]|nr:hypothetical protein [Saccharothrix sp.]
MPDEDDLATADFDRPNPARIHDWLLGGSLNTPIDREVVTSAPHWLPVLRDIARDNRAFLGDVVRRVLDRNVRQFLDLGSGLPTRGAVHHQVRHHPDATVVYVDNDPATVARANVILDTTPQAVGVHADLRDPHEVLGTATARRLLRLEQPLCLIAIDVLDTLLDSDEPARLLATYGEALAPGSVLALTHVTTWPRTTGDTDRTRFWERRQPRSPQVVRRWGTGWEPLPPGPPDRPIRYGTPDGPVSAEIARFVFTKP